MIDEPLISSTLLQKIESSCVLLQGQHKDKIKSEKKHIPFFLMLPNINLSILQWIFCFCNFFLLMYGSSIMCNPLVCIVFCFFFYICDSLCLFYIFQLFNQAKLLVPATFTSNWWEKIPFQPDHDKTRRTHRGR